VICLQPDDTSCRRGTDSPDLNARRSVPYLQCVAYHAHHRIKSLLDNLIQPTVPISSRNSLSLQCESESLIF
jgi:hypothetical protein